MSPNPENEYMSDGITEEIINALAGIQQLKVISRTSSFYFKNKKLPLKEIAEQLNVSIIIEGSIRVAGNIVRITAQLIQAADDFHFWSETWDRKLENIFEIQDEISLIIAEKLREQFGHFEIGEHLVKKQTENLDAYEYSLKAQFHFNKWNPQDVQTAISLYEKAIELDPKHTESYVGLADAYGFMATTEFMPRDETWKKAVEYTHRAYALDPNNAGVHYQLANLSFFTDCNFVDSAKHTLKALVLKPSYPEAQQYMSFLYVLSGQMEKAHHHLQLALGIDPLNHETLFYKAYYLYRNYQFEEAEKLLDEILGKNPKNIPAVITRSYVLLKLGKYDEVISTINNMHEEIVIPDEKTGILSLAYILQGDKHNSEKLLEILQTEAQKPMSFQAHSYLFLAYSNLGLFDKAFEWLEESLQIKSSIFLLSFSDPLVNGIKNDPRYADYHKRLYPQFSDLKNLPDKKTPLIEEETANNYTDKLLKFMNDEQPYLNPSITLRLLAEQVEIHPNQVSWLLNEKMGKNFNEFINHYRVEHFKELAVDSSNSNFSLIGLAYESGFNSKTVFNTFFKKETGMTPGEYLKNNK